MTEKQIAIVTGVMFSLLILPSVSSVAFAQYVAVDGQTGLDDYLKLAQDRVVISNENPKAGSGTPMFAADGVLGALILSTGIFGGIASTFFIRSRQGKYAVIGRG
ncbi:MAG: hypothetical protein OEL77_03025 [Nitrosopumilus sp.]|nr:hypothetical protein [Nitrosopumilus sp.]MDH3384968.1 hypothetical protein [Nitrosopumilus sp.]